MLVKEFEEILKEVIDGDSARRGFQLECLSRKIMA